MQVFSPLHPWRVKRLRRYITHLSNLVGYWPLWEGDGAVARNYAPDNLGSLNGTYKNSPSLGAVRGQLGRVPTFTIATKHYVDCGRDSALDPADGSFTLLIWFNTTDATNYKHFMSKGTTGGGGKRFQFMLHATENIVIAMDDDANNKVLGGDTDNLDDGTWHMASTTKGATYLRVYLDGTEDATAIDVSGSLTISDANKDFCIGINSSDENTQGWGGELAHAAYFTRELAASEILRMAQISGVA